MSETYESVIPAETKRRIAGLAAELLSFMDRTGLPDVECAVALTMAMLAYTDTHSDVVAGRTTKDHSAAVAIAIARSVIDLAEKDCLKHHRHG